MDQGLLNPRPEEIRGKVSRARAASKISAVEVATRLREIDDHSEVVFDLIGKGRSQSGVGHLAVGLEKFSTR